MEMTNCICTEMGLVFSMFKSEYHKKKKKKNIVLEGKEECLWLLVS